MKAVVEALPVPEQFKPFTLTLHVETAEEALVVYHVGNFSYMIGELIEKHTEERGKPLSQEVVYETLKHIFNVSGDSIFNGHKQ